MVEVYDPEALASYVFRSPAHVPLAIAVLAASWLAVRRPGAPEADRLDRLIERAGRHERAIVAGLALAAGAFSAWVATSVLGGVPHIQDERAYMFQARVMAAGRLWAPVPPRPLDEATAIDFTVQDGGRWYGRFPPGWPSLLAGGVRLGAAHLVNPLLTALGVIALHAFLAPLAGRRLALLAAALAATSPMLTLTGASFLAHPAALLAQLLGLAGYRSALERPRSPCAAALAWGGGAGLLLLIRPQEGVFLALVPGLHLAWRARSCARPALACLAAGLVPLAACGALLLGFHAATTGEMLTPPTLRFNPDDRPGFFAGAGTYAPEGHTPGRALHNVLQQWTVTADVLYGWPYLSLVPALVGLAGSFARLRPTAPAGAFERGWLALSAAYLALVFAYYNPGLGFGTRFHHVLLPQLLFYTVRGLALAARALGPGGRAMVLLVVVYLTSVSLATHYPRRIDDLRFHWRVFPAHRLLPRGDPARMALVVPRLWIDGIQEAFASFEALSTPYPGGAGPVAARDLPGIEDALRRSFPDRVTVRIDPTALRSALDDWVGRPVELSGGPARAERAPVPRRPVTSAPSPQLPPREPMR
jgi:hypothetical protein